jgi:hypothetical protein
VRRSDPDARGNTTDIEYIYMRNRADRARIRFKKTASVPFSNSLSNSSYGCLRDSRSPRDDVRGQCPEGPPTERRGMVTRHKLFQLRPSLHQWLVAKILPFRCRRSKPQKIRVCGRHRIADFSASKSEAPCPF